MARLRSSLPGRRWSGIAWLLIVAVVAGGCAGTDRSTHSEAPSGVVVASTPLPSPAPVVVSTPSNPLDSSTASAGSGSTRRLNSSSLTYSGEIMAEVIVPVVAEVAGQIQEVQTAVGASIQQGDLLARIDSTVAEAQRAQAQAALELAQSQLELAQTEPQQTDLDADRAGRTSGGIFGRARRRGGNAHLFGLHPFGFGRRSASGDFLVSAENRGDIQTLSAA